MASFTDKPLRSVVGTAANRCLAYRTPLIQVPATSTTLAYVRLASRPSLSRAVLPCQGVPSTSRSWEKPFDAKRLYGTRDRFRYFSWVSFSWLWPRLHQQHLHDIGWTQNRYGSIPLDRTCRLLGITGTSVIWTNIGDLALKTDLRLHYSSFKDAQALIMPHREYI
jgi:hypothetical protein